MKIATDEWKVKSGYLLLFLGVFVLIALLALWLVSLGHIRLASGWCTRLEELESRTIARQYEMSNRREVRNANK